MSIVVIDLIGFSSMSSAPEVATESLVGVGLD